MKIIAVNTKHYRFQTQGLKLEEAIHEAAAQQERGNEKLIALKAQKTGKAKSLSFSEPILPRNNAYLAVLYLLSFRPEVEIMLQSCPVIVFRPEDEAAIVSFLLDYP